MSMIRGKWTKIEREVHNWLKGNRIRHRMHPEKKGNPDVKIIDGGNPSYLFLDGCFWHCCPEHYKRPKSRQSFWIPHVEHSNKRREKLRQTLDYRWVRIWEHDIRNGTFRKMIKNSITL